MGASRPEADGGGTVERRRPLPGRAWAAVLLLGVLVAVPGAPAAAQEPARPVLRGQVLRGEEPLESGTVVLHRVTPDTAGEVDSTRVGTEGRFRFELPSVPDPGGRSDIYFASIRHQGVMYFGVPVSTGAQLDSLYRIEVHDTTLARGPGATSLSLAARYLFVQQPSEEEGWTVTDLMLVRNPGERTVVAPGGGYSWRYPLPPSAGEVEVGGGDVAPEAVDTSGDSVRIASPIPPGDRQFVFRYRLPSTEFTLPLPGPVVEVELLVEEPAPPLEVRGLQALEAVEVEDATYRRFVGEEMVDAVVDVRRGREAADPPVRWILAGLTVLLAVLGLWAVLRTRGPGREATPAAAGGAAPPPEPTPSGDRRQALVLEVARLDEARERGEVDEDEWRRKREALLARIRDLEGEGVP